MSHGVCFKSEKYNSHLGFYSYVSYQDVLAQDTGEDKYGRQIAWCSIAVTL